MHLTIRNEFGIMFTITYLIKLKVRARSPPKKQKQPRGEPQGKRKPLQGGNLEAG